MEPVFSISLSHHLILFNIIASAWMEIKHTWKHLWLSALLTLMLCITSYNYWKKLVVKIIAVKNTTCKHILHKQNFSDFLCSHFFNLVYALFHVSGCYPNCPPDKPYFHEDQMKCVSLCDCYDNEDGKIYMRDKCQLW